MKIPKSMRTVSIGTIGPFRRTDVRTVFMLVAHCLFVYVLVCKCAKKTLISLPTLRNSSIMWR